MPARLQPRRGLPALLIALLLLFSPFGIRAEARQLVLLGDSLSDTGNLFKLTAGTIPSPQVYPFPGRYSNGPVWIEYTVDRLGLTLDNRAYGGALSGSGSVEGPYPGLKEQLEELLGENSGQLDRDSIYMVWVGANDFLSADGSTPPRKLARRVAGNVVRAVRSLQRAGARRLLVLSLPDLGNIPLANSGRHVWSAQQLHSISLFVNRLLTDKLATLKSPVALYDVLALQARLTERAAQYEFDNVSDACISIRCEDPDSYMFWDQIHPTTRAHQLIAKGVIGALIANLPELGRNTDSVGMYSPANGSFELADSIATGKRLNSFKRPARDIWIPLAGDWNGNGIDTTGGYNLGTGKFRLAVSNGPNTRYKRFLFGPVGSGWLPITGDWNGNGRDTVGLYDPFEGRFRLRLSNAPGRVPERVFRHGPIDAGLLPVAGDWDGDGIDTIGLYDPLTARWRISNRNSRARPTHRFRFGPVDPGARILAGDWNGDGMDTPALYLADQSRFLFRGSDFADPPARTLRFGMPGSGALPIAGHWRSDIKP